MAWLTYVHRSLIESRGGSLPALIDRLRKERIRADVLARGVLEVQAAPTPEIADRSQEGAAPGHRTAGRALAGLRLDSEQSRFLPILGMDQQQPVAWYDRLFGAG